MVPGIISLTFTSTMGYTRTSYLLDLNLVQMQHYFVSYRFGPGNACAASQRLIGIHPMEIKPP